jgi:hypothetical protein
MLPELRGFIQMEDKSQERPKRPTTTKLSALYRKCNNAPGQREDNKRPALGAFAATIVSYVFFATAQSTAMGLLLTTVPFTVLIACNNHRLSSPAQTWYSQLNAYIRLYLCLEDVVNSMSKLK